MMESLFVLYIWIFKKHLTRSIIEDILQSYTGMAYIVRFFFWIEDFLSNRTQYVSGGYTFSDGPSVNSTL